MTSFLIEYYYLLNLLFVVGYVSALLIYLGRFSPDDPRTGALQRMLMGVLGWAAFDVLVGQVASRHLPATGFDLYRFLCFTFLFFIPAAGELVLSLMRPVTWRHRVWLYGPFLVFYLAAIIAPGLVTAKTFGLVGGTTLRPAPWNMVFKVYSIGLVGALLVMLAWTSRRETDPLARREKITLFIGGAASLSGIVVAEILRALLGPAVPWMANLSLVFFCLAAFWGLWRYGRVLSPRAMYTATIRLVPGGLVQIQDGRIARANPGLGRLVGASSPDDLRGRSLEELMDPSAHGPAERESLAARLIRGEVSGEEIVLAGAEGRAATCLVSSALFDPHRPGRGALAVFTDITARKEAERDREELIQELQEALVNVKTLRGLVPICSSCKKIRDDEGFWHQVEVYVRDHSEVQFSHGICPECMAKLYPGMARAQNDSNRDHDE
jgi:PAS domain S-box-containing protein